MSRWWDTTSENPYALGWLQASGAPFRTVEDREGVVHFLLGTPTSPKNGYSGTPGRTGCWVSFCWSFDFIGESSDPTPMTEIRANKLTCMLCIGAF